MLRAIKITEEQPHFYYKRVAENEETRKKTSEIFGCVYSHSYNGDIYVFPKDVYLDDERTPARGWFVVRTTEEMIGLLREYKGFIRAISLDHDLGTEKTGYDVLLWIEEQVAINGYVPPEIFIHTGNTSAEIKMKLAVKKIKELARKNEEKNAGITAS
jgi:hypothetical protein